MGHIFTVSVKLVDTFPPALLLHVCVTVCVPVVVMFADKTVG